MFVRLLVLVFRPLMTRISSGLSRPNPSVRSVVKHSTPPEAMASSVVFFPPYPQSGKENHGFHVPSSLLNLLS
jgi:hypothetical protein